MAFVPWLLEHVLLGHLLYQPFDCSCLLYVDQIPDAFFHTFLIRPLTTAVLSDQITVALLWVRVSFVALKMAWICVCSVESLVSHMIIVHYPIIYLSPTILFWDLTSLCSFYLILEKLPIPLWSGSHFLLYITSIFFFRFMFLFLSQSLFFLLLL